MAGAGSGKTRVLTHRIAYLLAERNVHPGEIIAITFTNKAAGEMKERVAALVGPRARLMWVSTFHSACVRILRAEHEHAGLKSTFSIYDADDSRRLMQMVARELDLDPKRYTARGLAAQVSNLKNELVEPEEFADRAKGPNERAVAEAYVLYQRRLKEAHALDFDDIIMATVHLLQSHPLRRGGVPAAVPARAGRRIPGHQPRAVHAGQGAGRPAGRASRRRASCAWSATRTSRSTRSAAPRSATSSSSSATTRTRAPSCWSRTTAPPRRSCPPPTR